MHPEQKVIGEIIEQLNEIREIGREKFTEFFRNKSEEEIREILRKWSIGHLKTIEGLSVNAIVSKIVPELIESKRRKKKK